MAEPALWALIAPGLGAQVLISGGGKIVIIVTAVVFAVVAVVVARRPARTGPSAGSDTAAPLPPPSVEELEVVLQQAQELSDNGDTAAAVRLLDRPLRAHYGITRDRNSPPPMNPTTQVQPRISDDDVTDVAALLSMIDVVVHSRHLPSREAADEAIARFRSILDRARRRRSAEANR